jgi:hypothetical protein
MDGMSSLQTVNHGAKMGYLRMEYAVYKRWITWWKWHLCTYWWDVLFINNKPYGQKQVVMDWISCLQTINHMVKKLTGCRFQRRTFF